jgi:hypothetical protein
VGGAALEVDFPDEPQPAASSAQTATPTAVTVTRLSILVATRPTLAWIPAGRWRVGLRTTDARF